MKIYSGSSNLKLAEKIASKLDLSVSPLEIFIFPDGERRVRIEDEVVDQDVVIVQSTSTPVDEHYMELFFLADSLKRSGAKSITLVMSYMGYMRQDHIFRSGEAVSLSVVIKIIESLGIDKVISFDLHTIKVPELFNIPVAHLSALELFATEIKKIGWDGLDSVLATPDMGGIRRIEIISNLLQDMPFVSVTKNRDLDTGIVSSKQLNGQVGKRVIIVDDMISSGHTIVEAANLLRENGAEEVIVFATHAIFSEEAPKILEESFVSKVYVTDSVSIPQDKHFPKLSVLSLSDMIAEELRDK